MVSRARARARVLIEYNKFDEFVAPGSYRSRQRDCEGGMEQDSRLFILLSNTILGLSIDGRVCPSLVNFSFSSLSCNSTPSTNFYHFRWLYIIHDTRVCITFDEID